MSNDPWRVNNGRGSGKSGVANHGYGQMNNSGPGFRPTPNKNPSENPYNNVQNRSGNTVGYRGATPGSTMPQPPGWQPGPQPSPQPGVPGAGFAPQKSSFEFEFLLLVLAIILSIGAFVVALTNSDKLPFGIACWIVSSPVVMSLLAIYFNAQSARRTKLDYTIPGWAGPLVWITLIVMFAAIVASAYAIADFVGRM